MYLIKVILLIYMRYSIIDYGFSHSWPGAYNCTCILFLIERPAVAPAEHNVTLGESVIFDCNEFGSPPFTYQWYMRSVMGTDTLLVGETGEFYNITSVMYNDTGSYFCEASNLLSVLSNSTPADLLGKNAAHYEHLSIVIKLFSTKLSH